MTGSRQWPGKPVPGHLLALGWTNRVTATVDSDGVVSDTGFAYTSWKHASSRSRPRYGRMDSSKTIVDVKTKLAEKYERLAKSTLSTPKRKQYTFRAVKYRRQADELARG